MNDRRRIALSAAAVLCTSVVAACGSGSKDSSATTAAATTIVDASSVPPVATTATTPATEPTADTAAAAVLDTTAQPTTTVDARPINADDQALALAATLHTEDFPAPWTQYSPGVAFSASADSCSYQPDGAITKVANGGLQTGPTEQLGETGAYSSTGALVFPDESVGYRYPELYTKLFGADYVPELHIQEAHRYARNHKWYMTSRLITVNDLYAFDPTVQVQLEEFTDVVGRHFRQPKEGLGFDQSPSAHMWRTINWPTRYL